MANSTDMAFDACARIRRFDLLADFPQASTRFATFLNIDPRDGKVGGWLYMASPDAFAKWRVTTVQDKVNVTAARKTGPASWSRVWISSGASVQVTVPTISSVGINQDDGTITALRPAPALRAWFVPYSLSATFETMQISLANNAWDTYPQLAAGATQDIGYAPRMCRSFYVVSRGSPPAATLNILLGIDFINYGQVETIDQGGIWADSWTSVSITNTAPGSLNILASWSNTPVSVTNP